MDKLKMFKSVRMAIMWKEGFDVKDLNKKTSRLFTVIFGIDVSVDECNKLQAQALTEYYDSIEEALGPFPGGRPDRINL